MGGWSELTFTWDRGVERGRGKARTISHRPGVAGMPAQQLCKNMIFFNATTITTKKILFPLILLCTRSQLHALIKSAFFFFPKDARATEVSERERERKWGKQWRSAHCAVYFWQIIPSSANVFSKQSFELEGLREKTGVSSNQPHTPSLSININTSLQEYSHARACRHD